MLIQEGMMRLHKLFTGFAVGSGLLLAVGASAQSTSGMGGTSQGSSNPSTSGSMGTTNQPPSGSASDLGTGSSQQGQVSQGNVNEAHQVSGTVSSISNGKISLKADDGSKLSLRTDQNTKIFDSSGNVAGLSQLQEGQQVRASYDVLGDQNHALRVDVIKSQGSQGQSGQSGSKSDTQQY